MPHLLARDAGGTVLAEKRWPAGAAPSFDTALDALLAFGDAHLGHDGLAAVGHRVVHGGTGHIVLDLITGVAGGAGDSLDPLHMPDNPAPTRAVGAARPVLPQVACFDTAFHHTLPPAARRFAPPRAVSDAGVRCYGFHGLYEFIAGCLTQQLPALTRGRFIVAHLGSGRVRSSPRRQFRRSDQT
jgi:acetate kinase